MVWVILASVAAVILLIVVIASCSGPRNEAHGGSLEVSQASAVGCYPPLACGPHYAGYIPPYYAVHPTYLYLSPYHALYSPVLVGKTYRVSRTPAGLAPVSARPAMPYPPGYKPVPGDFKAPTAPTKAAAAPVDKSTTGKKAPDVKAPTKNNTTTKTPSRTQTSRK